MSIEPENCRLPDSPDNTSIFDFPVSSPLQPRLLTLLFLSLSRVNSFLRHLVTPLGIHTAPLLFPVVMRSTSAVLAASAFWMPLTFGVHLHGRDINAPLLDYYDYIVVGCGISGLVVTNRLSEIASRTVLCIEAGQASVPPPFTVILGLNFVAITMRQSFKTRSTWEPTLVVSTTGTLSPCHKHSSMATLDQCLRAKCWVVAVF